MQYIRNSKKGLLMLLMFNEQLSFTVKIPRLLLVKINLVILVYLPLTGRTLRLWTLDFVSWYNHGQVFSEFKPLNIWIVSYHLSEYTLELFNLAGFLAHVQQFSRLLGKFKVWVSCEAVSDIFNYFFCLISYNGIHS